NPNFRLSERLLEALLAHKPEASEVVLLDFPEELTHAEQLQLLSLWKDKKKSYFAPPNTRAWTEKSLIYRRAVSWQLRSRQQDAKPFLDDWSSGKITVIGGWSSDVGMSKA